MNMRNQKMWFYKGEEFSIDQIDGTSTIGFVYQITNISNGKKYIGKKLFFSKKKLPPLKGKTRKRNVVQESDWKNYFGSSKELLQDLEIIGKENFRREILEFGISKSELSYKELKHQMENDVLFREDFYNGIINVRIHKNHIKFAPHISK